MVREGVAGRVVDEDGVPLAGAEIRVMTADAKETEVARVTSGEDGRFEVSGLKEGGYALHVLLPSGQENPVYAWDDAPGFFPFVRIKKAGEHVEFGDAKLVRRGMEVAGTVTDQDGAPIAKARVFVARNDGYHAGPAITDDGGRYKLLVSSWDRSWGVTALKILIAEEFLFAREYVDWEPWKTNAVDVTIDTNPVVVRGTVLHRGKPPADSRVYVYQAGQKSVLTYYPAARVGADGTYESVPLPHGSYEFVCRVQGAPSMTKREDLRGPNAEARADFSIDGVFESCTGRIQVKMAGREMSEWPGSPPGPYGVYLLDREGVPIPPYAPVAFLEGDEGAWTFRISGLKPERYGLRLHIVDDGKGVNSTLELLHDRSVNSVGSFYLVHEPWRPFPSDRILDTLVFDARVDVAANEGVSITIEKDFSIEELRGLIGPAAEQFVPE